MPTGRSTWPLSVASGAAEERFFRGYFTEGVAIGDHGQLAALAVDAWTPSR
jgi:hypothetical protein